MRIMLVDDDKNILNILKMIITDRGIGEICGAYSNTMDAMEDIRKLWPDIAVVDLLMPEMDGITFVKRAKAISKKTVFVMLSQVSSKDMIASAYEKGVETYIQKPINSVEVERVLSKVIENIRMKQTLAQMQNLIANAANGPGVAGNSQYQGPASGNISDLNGEMQKPHVKKVTEILQRLGLLGDIGSKDIIALVDYLVENREHVGDSTLNELCSHFSDSPKSVEQRIRRTAIAGMVNLANMGIEDYSNDTFIEYASSLYNFEQVRKEMDYIRGKSERHGNVKVKNFLNSLVAFSKN